MTLVSAVIPTYRRPEFIGGAVDTALSQTYQNIEVIVVCDPPADETQQVLERFTDERVRAFYNRERLGIAASRNRAIEHAAGEYVCVLDDDDRWDPTKVEKQLAAMKRLDEGYGVVYTYGTVKRDGRVINYYRSDRRGNLYPEILAGAELDPYSSHMFRAEVFERVGGYDPAFPVGEDWELAIRVAREYKYERIPELLTHRLFHGSNVSQIPRERGVPDRIREKHGAELRRHPAIERRFRARRLRGKAKRALDQGKRLEALRYGGLAMRLCPSPEAVLILSFACFGRNALGMARRVRNAWAAVRSPEFD